MYKLLFVFLLVVELFLFIEISSQIGVWATIFWLIGTALAGIQAFKFCGAMTSYFSYYSAVMGQDPSQDVINSFIIMVGGILLIIPGVLTDIMGVLCLFPSLRRYVTIKMAGGKNGSGGGPKPGTHDPDHIEIIEGKYRRHR